MTERIHTTPTWDPASPSWRFSALAGVSLVALGTIGLARPRTAARAFGIGDLDAETAGSWRPKAARDLATGAMALALLALGNKRALGVYATACTLIPASDAVIVALGGSRRPWQVAMHAATGGLTLALGASLLRQEA